MMANIPPLLSSSPPPLDITDDAEDFIDIHIDNYDYDVLPEEPYFNNKEHFYDRPISLDEHITNIESKPDVNNVPVYDEIQNSNSILPNNYPIKTNNDAQNTCNPVEHSQLTDTLPLPLTSISESPVSNTVEEDSAPSSPHNDVYLESLDFPDKLNSHLTEPCNNILFSSCEVNNCNQDENTGESLKEMQNECCESEVIKNDVEPFDHVEDFDDFNDFVSATEPTEINAENVDALSTMNKLSLDDNFSNFQEAIPVNNSIVIDKVQNLDVQSINSDSISIEHSFCENKDDEPNVDTDSFEFEDFQSVTIPSEMKPLSDINKSSVDELNNKCEETNVDSNNDFGEDFGDFNSFATESSPVENQSAMLEMFKENFKLYENKDFDALHKKLLEAVTMIFPVIDEKHSDHDTSSNVKIELSDSLKDMEGSNATKFKWKNSNSFNKTLKALNIDSRNIMYGTRWNVPRFASNLGDSLEPLKPKPVLNTNASHIETGSFSFHDNAEVPAAKFDWVSSGLINPLDDTSFVNGKENIDYTNLSNIEKNNEIFNKLTSGHSSELIFEQNENINLTNILNEEKMIEKISKSQTSDDSKNDDLIYVRSNGCDKINTNINDKLTSNKITSLSFHLPETHIFTSPVTDTSENMISQSISFNSVDNKYSMPMSKLNYSYEDNLRDDNITKFDETFSKKETFVDDYLMDMKSFQSPVYQPEVQQNNYPMIADDIKISNNQNINSINSSTNNDRFIKDFESNLSKMSKALETTIDDEQIEVSKINDNAISSKPKNIESSDDFDTSFTEFQSYEFNKEMQNSNQSFATSSPSLTQNHQLFSASVLLPNVQHQNIGKTSASNISCPKTESIANLNNKNMPNFVNKNFADDTQTEWSDFVSITTNSSAPNTLPQNKAIDINAFKVPIQIDPAHIRPTFSGSSRSIDGDDWSEFISSTPSLNSTNNLKKIPTSNKWNKVGPQFSSWQSSTYHNYHTGTNSLSHNESIISNYNYSKPVTGNLTKSTLGVSTLDQAYAHSDHSKSNNFIHNNSLYSTQNSKISNISTVPELGFAVPQSLMRSASISKK